MLTKMGLFMMFRYLFQRQLAGFFRNDFRQAVYSGKEVFWNRVQKTVVREACPLGFLSVPTEAGSENDLKHSEMAMPGLKKNPLNFVQVYSVSKMLPRMSLVHRRFFSDDAISASESVQHLSGSVGSDVSHISDQVMQNFIEQMSILPGTIQHLNDNMGLILFLSIVFRVLRRSVEVAARYSPLMHAPQRFIVDLKMLLPAFAYISSFYGAYILQPNIPNVALMLRCGAIGHMVLAVDLVQARYLDYFIRSMPVRLQDKLVLLKQGNTILLFLAGLSAITEKCGFPTDSVMTVGGLGGAFLVFSMRDTIKNVMCGLFVHRMGDHSIGDVVKVSSFSGRIVEKGFIFTYLIGENKEYIIVPNSLFISEVSVNKTRAGKKFF